MWQAEFNLYLYPDNPELIIETEEITSLLSSLEFVGENIESQRYTAGENFLSLLCFMGCSPNIELEPQDDKPYCYIETHGQANKEFISGRNTRKVHCTKCDNEFTNLLPIIREQALANTLEKIRCSTCDQYINPTKINWRRSAFLASSWIVVGNIYESEAVPDDKLLAALTALTGVDWKYAYVRADKLEAV